MYSIGVSFVWSTCSYRFTTVKQMKNSVKNKRFLSVKPQKKELHSVSLHPIPPETIETSGSSEFQDTTLADHSPSSLGYSTGCLHCGFFWKISTPISSVICVHHLRKVYNIYLWMLSSNSDGLMYIANWYKYHNYTSNGCILEGNTYNNQRIYPQKI